MFFAIFCTDKPNSSAIRAANRDLHLDYIRGVMDRVFIAGPTLTDDETGMNGGLLIMEFTDKSQAEDFVAHDPYTKADLFESVIIRPWKKVFPDN
ncbi:MAG: YciI family protein [Magnetovibrio sp.]|nr:YciI family protein [Magnetovibrio sp.]